MNYSIDPATASPHWANAGKTAIDAKVTFPDVAPSPIPFLARPDDVELHGRLIYDELLGGAGGPIADYDPALYPPPPSALDVLRQERDSRLQACDWTELPDTPLTTAKQQEWRTYRQALRDLPANTADPANPTWPTPPAP